MFRSLILSGALLFSSAALANQPDLSIETIFGFNGADVEVHVWVVNNGDAQSNSAYVDLYGSTGGLWKVDQTTHSFQYTGPLDPGDRSKLVFTLTHDEWENYGPIFATVDVDLTVNESDETNNMAQLVLLETDPNEPDLACGDDDWVPVPLMTAPYMTLNFLQTNVPYFSCKSRVL